MSHIDAYVLSKLTISGSGTKQPNLNCKWNQPRTEVYPQAGKIRNHVNLVLLLFCCLPVALTKTASAATISYVQGNYATPQTSQSTVSVSYKSAQTAGDLNVVVVGWNNSTAAVKTISDSAGNAYSLAVGPTIVKGALTQSIYFAKNIASAAAGSNSVTITFSRTAAYPDIRILEYSGADPNNPVDVSAVSSGSGTTNSVSATTTNATDLLFAANVVQSMTTGAGTGFTKRLLTQPDGDIAEDQMVAAGGSYTATAPTNGADPWIMQMIAFRTPAILGNSPSLTPSSLSCTNSSMTGSGTDTCTVTLNTAASSGGLAVALASNNSAASVPSSVTVAAGAASASFSATVSAVSSAQTVTLTASANGVTQTFALQLNVATTATLSLNATSIAFGNVKLNTPTTQSLTLTSTGGSPVTVSSATVSGTGFSLAGGSFPITLNPNQSTTASIEFDPTASGAAAGTLTITSNSSSNPNATVSLSGTGVASSYSVLVSWNAPSSSPDPVAGYNIYRSPSGGSNYQLMGSVNSGTLSYSDGNSIQNGQTYDYIVESVDASGNESVPSNMASATIP